MNITIIGVGYVGLVTGACFAETGNTVYCVDNDSAKIALLEKGASPIFEPGLTEMLTHNLASKNLLFGDWPLNRTQMICVKRHRCLLCVS